MPNVITVSTDESSNDEFVLEKDTVKGQELLNYFPALQGCRSVEEYECLNRIEEGAYGVVFRAKDKRSGEVVALKRVKTERETNGFPITSLREINMLLKAQHPNMVSVQEIVVGSNFEKIYIVMEYLEHDLNSLMKSMKKPFLIGEVKTLMSQLLSAVAFLHDNWILHRDLKTSNLLMNHKGILKVADFGLSREYGSPLKPYTPLVVTLWYRAPELLLGSKPYSCPIDVWSVGCIFAEFLTLKTLFCGKSEHEQINCIYRILGTPNENIWPGYSKLPMVEKIRFEEHPYNCLSQKLDMLSPAGFNLINRLLAYCADKRSTAKEALEHAYFKESPLPIQPNMFPTWPAKSELNKVRRPPSPKVPRQSSKIIKEFLEDDYLTYAGKDAVGGGFCLKF